MRQRWPLPNQLPSSTPGARGNTRRSSVATLESFFIAVLSPSIVEKRSCVLRRGRLPYLWVGHRELFVFRTCGNRLCVWRLLFHGLLERNRAIERDGDVVPHDASFNRTHFAAGYAAPRRCRRERAGKRDAERGPEQHTAVALDQEAACRDVHQRR